MSIVKRGEAIITNTYIIHTANPTQHKCDFRNLGVSPAQYNMFVKADCDAFFEAALQPGKEKNKWIGKGKFDC